MISGLRVIVNHNARAIENGEWLIGKDYLVDDVKHFPDGTRGYCIYARNKRWILREHEVELIYPSDEDFEERLEQQAVFGSW